MSAVVQLLRGCSIPGDTPLKSEVARVKKKDEPHYILGQ